jgi:hypothetical protein
MGCSTFPIMYSVFIVCTKDVQSMKLIKYIEVKSEITAFSQKTHNSTFTFIIQSNLLACPTFVTSVHDLFVPCASSVFEATMQDMFNLFLFVSHCPLNT